MDKTIEFRMPVVPFLMGVDARHDPAFRIDRPHDPYGSCLILGFRSEAVIRTAAGLENAQPGDCIVHTPGFSQFHTAVPGAATGYSNDWLHVRSDVLRRSMRAYALPFNRLLHTGDGMILAPYLRRLCEELLLSDPLTERGILNVLESMMIALARAVSRQTSSGVRMTISEQRLRPIFDEVRSAFLIRPEQPFSLRLAARRTALSPVRFAALYRLFYGRSPYSELLDARLNSAKRLLLESVEPVKEIAALCGWRDPHYFTRLFTAKTGRTPTSFRASAGRVAEP